MPGVGAAGLRPPDDAARPGWANVVGGRRATTTEISKGERRPLPTPDRRSGRPNNETVRRALPARYPARACHRRLQDCDRFHDDVIRQQRDANTGTRRTGNGTTRRTTHRHCPARTAKCQPGAVTRTRGHTRGTTQRKRGQERVRRDRPTQMQHERTGVLPRRAA